MPELKRAKEIFRVLHKDFYLKKHWVSVSATITHFRCLSWFIGYLTDTEVGLRNSTIQIKSSDQTDTTLIIDLSLTL